MLLKLHSSALNVHQLVVVEELSVLRHLFRPVVVLPVVIELPQLLLSISVALDTLQLFELGLYPLPVPTDIASLDVNLPDEICNSCLQ